MNEYIGLILFGSFALLLLLKVPVSFSLGISSLICIIIMDVPLVVVGQRIFTALDSFPIMAIPFFILSGNLMIEGGLSKKIVSFALSILARVRGGLAMAAILACAIFGALSGSGPATVISIGGMIYPEMVKRGYDKQEMAGLIATSGSLGPTIPPSIVMVFFGTVTSVSITKMFAGGLSLGILLALMLLGVTYYRAVKYHWPKASEQEALPKFWANLKDSFWALMMPVIVLGGIYGGFFTPTEAAAVSVFYALIVGLFIYKELDCKKILRIVKESAAAATIVLFIIAASSAFAWLFTYANIAAQVNEFVTSFNVGPTLYLTIVVIVMLIFGTFMDATATIVLLMPMMYPLSQALGVDPIHFGVTVCFALTLGGLTPPVAVNLFAMASISKLSMGQVARGEVPYALTALACLIVAILVPVVTTFLPSLM